MIVITVCNTKCLTAVSVCVCNKLVIQSICAFYTLLPVGFREQTSSLNPVRPPATDESICLKCIADLLISFDSTSLIGDCVAAYFFAEYDIPYH